jgi:NADH dehydrogenase
MPALPAPPVNNILVLGGTGFVGRCLCEKLVERLGSGNARITVPTRYPSRSGHIQTLPMVEVVASSLRDDAQLRQLVHGRDAVVNLVAILHGSEDDFRHVHVDLPIRLARACLAAGTRRVVHVSALGADAQAPSKYLRSKAAGEAVLRGSLLDVTVLRPSVIFGEQDRFMNRFAALQSAFPLMPLAGADARFQPVWVDDVADAIVCALQTPSSAGEVIECVGPAVHTLKELVQMAGRWSGHPRPVLELPNAIGWLQAAMLELLPGEPLMSRDNLDSMEISSIASGQYPTLARFGIVPRSIESVMPTPLGRHAGPARLEPWRALARRH